MADASEPQFRIGVVARLTGLSIDQIRVWERRYHVVEPQRSDGGDRLYSEHDVGRLSLLKRLNDLGHSIGSTARLPSEQLERMLALHEGMPHAKHVSPPPSVSVSDLTEPFLEAIEALDVLRAERVLARAAGSADPSRFTAQILLPLLEEVGRRWADGELTVAHEHAASAVMRTQLGGLMRTFVPDPGAPVAICATPAGELHEFGALAAALHVASRGWRVIYLGPNLPSEEIVQATRVAKAQLVLLSVVCTTERTLSELRSLAEALPRDVTLMMGGAAASTLVGVPARVRRAQTLADLEPLL